MFEINTLELKGGDILIVHFNRDVDMHTMNELINYIKQYLPDNDVIAANNYYVNGMTVIHKEKQELDDTIWRY